jgi:hypothetical protein
MTDELPPVITREQISEALKKGYSVGFNIADLQDPADPQGRSYRQINAEKKHAIPLGALVELEDGERLYVAHHGRDCDQTPLYGLSMKDWATEPIESIRLSKIFRGYAEEDLTVIRQPD